MTDTKVLSFSKTDVPRCTWVGKDPLMIQYHDHEWGIPVHDDRQLFEFLILEGAQAGLNWATILHKRPAYKKLFDNFDPHKVAQYTDAKIAKLISNPGIVRNQLKINSAVTNAKAFLAIQKAFGSFDRFIWGFVDNKTIQNKYTYESQIPSQTQISQNMSLALKKRGFKFVGPTICYAFMQATGMVNDHTTNCFRHKMLR